VGQLLQHFVRRLVESQGIEVNPNTQGVKLVANNGERFARSLDDAQKDLLRMGPQNIRKIQKKLREIAVALGVSENQLPRSKGYPK